MTSRHRDCDSCGSLDVPALTVLSLDGAEVAVFCGRCVTRVLDAVSTLLPAGKGSPRFHAWRERRTAQRDRAREAAELQTAERTEEAARVFRELLERTRTEPAPRRRR